MDSQDLVRSLLNGDPAAGAFLVSHYAPELLGYAAARGSDISETDRELLCERAVEKAVDKIDQFDPRKGSFAAWLRGILRYEILEWRRHHLSQIELKEELIEGRPSIEPMELEAEEATSPGVLVTDFLDQLSGPDRLIVQLRDLEGLTYSAIARTLNVLEAACRQRHKRAIQRLTKLATTDHIPIATQGGEDQ